MLLTQQAFASAGLQVPQIIAQDIQQGFLLLSDLGDTLLLSKLTEDTASSFYRQALAQLAQIPPHQRNQCRASPCI